MKYEFKLEITNKTLKKIARIHIQNYDKAVKYARSLIEQFHADDVKLNSHGEIEGFVFNNCHPMTSGVLWICVSRYDKTFVPTKYTAHKGYRRLLDSARLISSIHEMPFSLLYLIHPVSHFELIEEKSKLYFCHNNSKFDLSKINQYCFPSLISKFGFTKAELGDMAEELTKPKKEAKKSAEDSIF